MELIDSLNFDKAGGLVTAIAVDDATDEILMVAFMNPEAFRKTLEIRNILHTAPGDAASATGTEANNVRQRMAEIAGKAMTKPKVVALGISTGGPQALAEMI